jgi:hypothetical protein
MSLPLRPLAVFSLLSALATVVLAPGCSRQGEGERCHAVNGDTDCDDGLKCVSQNKLQNDGGSDRCCNPDETTFSDSRCQPGTEAPTGNGGAPATEGGTGSGAQATAAGESSVGGVGGAPVVPDDTAGAGGLPAATGGAPTTPEAGAPNGGVPATPAGGQGGSD